MRIDRLMIVTIASLQNLQNSGQYNYSMTIIHVNTFYQITWFTKMTVTEIAGKTFQLFVFLCLNDEYKFNKLT